MRATDANETSSRSHLLFTMHFESEDFKTPGVKTSKMTFIDLAGSERLALIGFDEHLYEEALFINESLRCLERVIKLLALGRTKESIDFDGNHLTHLLLDSLGGSSKSLLLVMISPSVYDLEATMDTLKFAQRTGKAKGLVGLVPDQTKMSDKFLAFKMIKSISSSPEFVCETPGWKIEATLRWPDVEKLGTKTLQELMAFRPVTIRLDDWFIGAFGLVYSDGSEGNLKSRYWKGDQQLPDNVTKIEVVFSKTEQTIRYFRFYSGDQMLQVPERGDDGRGGRTETFLIEEGERWIGCDVLHGDTRCMGIRWLKWKLAEMYPK